MVTVTSQRPLNILIRYKNTVPFHHIILFKGKVIDYQIISRAVNSLPNVLFLVKNYYFWLHKASIAHGRRARVLGQTEKILIIVYKE